MLAGETLDQMVARHEGTRATPYRDSKGIWTVGIGHNMNRPLSDAAIRQIYVDDVTEATEECLAAFSWFPALSQGRQWALIDLCFNLGLSRLLGFHRMLSALAAGDYATAKDELLTSEWAKDVQPERVADLAALFLGSVEV